MSGGHVEKDPLPIRATTAQQVVLAEAHTFLKKALLIVEAEWKRRAQRSRRTGTYLRSITSRVTRVGNTVVGFVGTSLFYAPYLEHGTGLYGPRHRWITPVKAQALRWPQKGNKSFTLAGRPRSGRAGAGAAYTFAKRTRGMRPRKFAQDAALVTRPLVIRTMQAGAHSAARRIEALA